MLYRSLLAPCVATAWLLIGLATTADLAACGESSSCADGTRDCPCAADRFCDPGLSCQSGTCVGPTEGDLDASDASMTDLTPEDVPPPLTFVVTFDPQGGTLVGEATRTLVTLDLYGELPDATRTDFDFTGWWTAPVTDPDGVEVTAETRMTRRLDHTLYARWSPIPKFVEVEPGGFMLGSPGSEPDSGGGEVGREWDELQAEVTLTRGFTMGDSEVTQWQWKTLSGGLNPSHFRGCDSCPVENVTWWSIFGYANARSTADGAAPCFKLPTSQPDGTPCTGTWQAGTLDCGEAMPELRDVESVYDCTGWRLPTEAEWEYAARAGTVGATYGGELSGAGGCVTLTGDGDIAEGTPLADLGWYACNNTPNGTKEVKGKRPNAWALFDMLGNVSEWTWDRYAKDSTGGTGGDDPAFAESGFARVYRGGSWVKHAGFLRSANRMDASPGARGSFLGFRLVKSLVPAPPTE